MQLRRREVEILGMGLGRSFGTGGVTGWVISLGSYDVVYYYSSKKVTGFGGWERESVRGHVVSRARRAQKAGGKSQKDLEGMIKR